MKYDVIAKIVVAAWLLSSCHMKDQEVTIDTAQDNNYVILTISQFETGNFLLGYPEKMIFEHSVTCNGRIEAEPSAEAMISPVIPGLVKEIYFTEGQKVHKGEALFELTGNEFIELQKELAETASKLIRMRSEYERLKSLYSDNIGSHKDLIYAESEFKAGNSNYSALKMKAEMLGLNVERIENGDFYGSFVVRSPIDGYVSDIMVSLGQYVDQHMAMTKVYDASRLHLKIAVFEKDIRHLKVGQKVRFKLPGDTMEFYNATLHSVGKNVDQETKTILCCAEIDNCCKSYFVHNAYVQAEVVSKSDSVYALPEDAILRYEGNNYIMISIKTENERYYFQRLSVQTGRNYNGFTEIIGVPPERKLITQGAYNLNPEQ